MGGPASAVTDGVTIGPDGGTIRPRCLAGAARPSSAVPLEPAASPLMNVHLIHVPYDSGHRAVRMGAGPVHFAANGAADRMRAAGHAVDERWIERDQTLRGEIESAFELDRLLAGAVAAARDGGALPIVLAGNCITSLGTVSGLGATDLGVVWFDAHPDLHTPESTTSGFLDGMALSLLMGRCWHEMAATVPGALPIASYRIAMVGVRDVDPGEQAPLLAEGGIARVLVEDVRRLGAAAALAPALDALAREVRRVYVHLDLDVHDSVDAPVNAFRTPPGLLRSEVRDAVRAIVARFEIAGAALTAYDPSVDPDGRTLEAGIALMLELAAGRVA